MRSIAAIVLAAACGAQADQLTFQYDELGRLIEVKASPAKVVHYDYDASGNLQAVSSDALATLGIAGFSPSRAPVGASVVISGSAFSATKTSNTVKFNGTAATVTAASDTALTVTVPAGATSGPVSVTVGTSTVTSADSFTVTSDQPTITGFTPTSGPVGTQVTLTGTNFSTTPANDQVTFGGTQAAAPAAPTATQIKVLVPAGAGSGHIGLTTPGGSVFSAGDFIATPTGTWPTGCTTPSSYGASTRVALGTTQTSLTLAAGQAVPVLFQANAGKYLTLATSSMTSASVSLALRGPQGDFVAIGNATTCATLVPADKGLELPPMPDAGTYTLFVTAPGAGSIKLAVEPPITGTLTLGAAATPVTFAAPAQRALESFTLGNTTPVTVTATSSTLGGGTLAVLDPSGRTVTTTSLPDATTTTLSPKISVPGTYSVLVDPATLAGGSVQLAVAKSAAATLLGNGTATITLSGTVKSASATFQGAAGRFLTLVVSPKVAMTRAYSETVKVTGPDGATVSTATLSSPTGAIVNQTLAMPALPSSGQYTVTVSNGGTDGYVGDVLLTLTTPLTTGAVLAVGGAPVNMGASRMLGQGELVDLVADANETLTVTAFHSGTSGVFAANVIVLSTDGLTVLAQGTLTAAPSGTTNVSFKAPVSGTYSVLLQQTGASSTGTESFTLAGPPDGAVLGMNTTTTVDAKTLGGPLTMYFNGTAGDFMNFTIGMAGNADTGYQGNVVIFSPSQQLVASGYLLGKCASMYWTYNCGYIMRLWNLPESGSYRIVYQQNHPQTSGTLTFVPSKPKDFGTFAAPVTGNQSHGTMSGLLPGQAYQFELNAVKFGGYGLVLSANDGSAPIMGSQTDSSGPGSIGAMPSSNGNGDGTGLLDIGFATADGTYKIWTSYPGNLVPPTTRAYNWIMSTGPAATSVASAGSGSSSAMEVFDGQPAMLYFNGTAGQALKLTLKHVTTNVAWPFPDPYIISPTNQFDSRPSSAWSGGCTATGAGGACVQWTYSSTFTVTPRETGKYTMWTRQSNAMGTQWGGIGNATETLTAVVGP